MSLVATFVWCQQVDEQGEDAPTYEDLEAALLAEEHRHFDSSLSVLLGR